MSWNRSRLGEGEGGCEAGPPLGRAGERPSLPWAEQRARPLRPWVPMPARRARLPLRVCVGGAPAQPARHGPRPLIPGRPVAAGDGVWVGGVGWGGGGRGQRQGAGRCAVSRAVRLDRAQQGWGAQVRNGALSPVGPLPRVGVSRPSWRRSERRQAMVDAESSRRLDSPWTSHGRSPIDRHTR